MRKFVLTAPKAVALLREHGAKATFFVIGGQVSGREEILKEIVAGGHELGNHAMHDEYARALADGELEAQIDYNKILEAISIIDADTNERICADPWELGPGSKDKSTKFGHTREESVALWHEHKVSFARLIPSKKSAGACLYLF